MDSAHHDHHTHEGHFSGNQLIRDVIIGMADGLTVPFALAAGLTGAVSHSDIVVTAGLAEIAAGSISMGLGGYLAGKSDMEHFQNERRREEREIVELPEREEQEIRDILADYGVSAEEAQPVVEALKRNPVKFVDFMMKFELGLETPDTGQAMRSGLTIGGAYIVGGFIPLLPYMFCKSSKQGLMYSVISTMSALLIFGFIKGKVLGMKPFKSGVETLVIGGVAAATAYLIAFWVQS